MPTGLRLTRSHITTIKAVFNPFHAPTARPVQLLLSLVSMSGKTTSDNSLANQIKGSPSPNVNVLINVLPRTSRTAEVTVGYTDGKTERIVLETQSHSDQSDDSKQASSSRKPEEAMSIQELVTKVDGWARVLKQKDE